VCGIVGYHDRESSHNLPEIALALAHRGPDGTGVWIRDEIGLAATRLSLLDLEHGAQPMVNEDGQVAVALNGEIYNHAKLRAELRSEGISFRGRSDTEVLLRGFIRWGPRVLERLEGMFAVAMSEGRRLHLARDTFGMKPLFWWLSSDRQALAFGSEIKALLRFPGVPRRLDPAALVEEMVFGHTLGVRTLLREIEQLAPGTLMTIERRGSRLEISTERFAMPRPAATPPSAREAGERIGELLRESVVLHIHADHPVATYLSGGADSTLLASLRPDHPGSKSFVVADGKHVADLAHAAEVANALGLDHEPILIPREPPLSWLANAVLAMEAPRAPTLALVSAPRVRSCTKAALCGEGADELLSGYSMHERPGPYLDRFEQRLAQLQSTSALPASAFETTEAQLAALRPDRHGDRPSVIYDFLLHQVMPNKHLAIWDRGAMAASLEVRMPYLTRGIRDLSLSLPKNWASGSAKELIGAAMQRTLRTPLAERIATRTKTAAPDALEVTRRRLGNLAASAMPSAWHSRHPLRQICTAPHMLFLLDLFLIAFIERDGSFPHDFAAEALYTRHERELRASHESACDALLAGR
jgi:asparagine synthase (glutamine-hydrolysing)